MPLYHKIVGVGEDLVLLHGWGFHSDVWLSLLDRLKGQYRVHLIDLPGFGRSRQMIFPELIHEVVEQLLPVLPASAIYVGWSLGGLIALQLGLSYPHQVKRLLTLGSTPCFLQQKQWVGVRPKFFAEFNALLDHNIARAYKQFAWICAQGAPNAKKLYKQLLLMMPRYGWPELSNLQKALRVLQLTDLRNELDKMHCPTQHWVSQQDSLAPVNSQFHTQVLPTGGHVVQLSQPEMLTHYLLTLDDELFIAS